MSLDLSAMADRLAMLGQMSSEDARTIAQSVYADGIVSRHEAEQLFEINNKLAGKDADWDLQFVETIKDFLVTIEAPEGWVTEEEGDWLIEQISKDGEVKLSSELDLMVEILRKAEGAPLSLSRFALRCVCERVRAQGRALSEDVERLRFLLYASSGEGQAWVTRYEAMQLFRLNDEISNAKNDPSWNELFARAIGNHLLASAHPNPVDEAEAFRREIWVKDTSSSAAGFFGRMFTESFEGGFNGWFQKVTYSEEKAKAARRAALEAARRDGEEVTDDETNWLMKRLGWDNKISPAEKALIDFLKKEAPGFVNGVTVAAAA